MLIHKYVISDYPQAKGTVKKTAISMVQYPEGVDFGAEKAQLVFGIAGIGS